MTLLNPTQEHYWRDRYALRDDKNEVTETDITATWTRVADSISDGPEEASQFLGILQDFKFVPAGRILSGAGAQSEKTFYNCYVIPIETKARRLKRRLGVEAGATMNVVLAHAVEVEDHGSDSREAILDTVSTMVGIMSRGGGVGINWSVLRPATSHLVRVSGTSSGPVGWMHVASTAVGEVIQGGSRRGAAMFMLDIWHPDTLNFINAKRDNARITNANVSVGVTDKFMEALSRDEDWTFEFPDTTHPSYDELWEGDIEDWRARGLPLVPWLTQSSRSVWEAISGSAHASGEPGVIFLDRYNDLSTANGEERIICVNPCGEQGLGAYSVCNLGAMNLYAYVEPYIPGPGFAFDFKRFTADVKTAIRFLDNVIDKTPDYLPETTERQRRLRRIGLGVMGLADALVALGVRYGSLESVSFVEDVFRTMKDAAIESSISIAEEKGPAEGWTKDKWVRPYLKEYADRAGSVSFGFPPLRNIFLLTQAPTGTTSLLADVNSGIEPYFNKKAVWRKDRTGERAVFPRAIQDLFFPDGGYDPGVLYDIPDYVVDSSEVTVDEHIAVQAAVQKYVDSSVSKTINAPKEQTPSETARAFTRAYYSGLKGIAYYRDGSRDQQVLYHQNPNDRIRELEARVEELSEQTRKLDRRTVGDIRMNYVAPSMKPRYMDNIQIFGAQGDTDVDRERALGSIGFYGPMNVLDQKTIDLVNGSSQSHPIVFADAGIPYDVCPSCEEGNIVREEGCMKCHECGWSAC